MKRNRKALFFLLASTLSLSIYAYTISAEPISKETYDKDKLTMMQTATLITLEPETIEEISNLIVEGVVVGISEPFEVVSDTNEPLSVFRYYYVKPNNIIKNTIEHNENDLIPIRVEGGETENLRSVFEESPKLKLNDEKLFFLVLYGGGGGTQTNDYYFDVVGVNQGILEKNSSIYTTEKNSLLKIDEQQLKNIKNKYDIEKSKRNNNSISLKKETLNKQKQQEEENLNISIENGVFTEEARESHEKQRNIYGKSKLKKNKYSKYTDKSRKE